LISVVIPCYNSPDLWGTLESLMLQDYPHIQPVLVDDGSSGFCPEEAERFFRSHDRGNLRQVTVLQNPENRGTVYTMNRALAHCRGEYIFNLAGDDCFADPRVLSDWVEAFLQTGAQVMTARRSLWDRELARCLGNEPTAEQIRSLREKSPGELFEELAKTNYIFGSVTARTAESFRRYGLYDEGYRLIEDHPTVLKLLRLGEPILFFDRTVVKCRTGGSSCAENYNEAYARDVDRILTCEVLPYTVHPKAMKRAYAQWQREQRILKKRAKLFQHFGTGKPARLLIGLWYYLHHPVRVICKLPKKLLHRKL
jgi:GT2 family glycosyltransferase